MAKTIKYNPFNAASIMLAMLMFMFELGKNGDEEIEFVYSEEEGDPKVLDFFELHQKEAKRDTSKIVYPSNSVFRKKDTPLLLWGVSDEGGAAEWRKSDSESAKAAVVGMYGNLKSSRVRALLKYRLIAPDQEGQITNMKIKAEALVESGLYELLQEPTVKKILIEKWHNAEQKVMDTGEEAPPVLLEGDADKNPADKD